MHVSAIIDFYLLEALTSRIVAEPENMAQEKLIETAKEKLAELVPQLALAQRDYAFVIGLGEARWVFTKCTEGLELDELAGHTGSRESAYSLARIYDPCPENFMLLKRIFDTGSWRSGFGGYSWGVIMETAARYGTMTDIAYVDLMADAQHNSGTAYSKPECASVIDFTLDVVGPNVASFLKWKRDSDILAPMPYSYDTHSGWLCYISSTVMGLVRRYHSLWRIPRASADDWQYHSGSQEHSWSERSYSTGEWGTRILGTPMTAEEEARLIVRCTCCSTVLRGQSVFQGSNGKAYCVRCAREYLRQCYSCKKWHPKEDGEIFDTNDGKLFICAECAPERVKLCKHCGSRVITMASYRINGAPVCSKCTQELYTQCYDCATFTANADIHQHLGSSYCPACYQGVKNRIGSCVMCGDYILKGQELHEHKGCMFCASCWEHSFTCEQCGTRKRNGYKHEKLVGGKVFCDDCAESYPECKACHAVHATWEMRRVRYGGFLCGDCLKTHCADCGEPLHDSYTVNKVSICDACYHARYALCSRCGSAHGKGDMYYSKQKDLYYCHNCTEGLCACVDCSDIMPKSECIKGKGNYSYTCPVCAEKLTAPPSKPVKPAKTVLAQYP